MQGRQFSAVLLTARVMPAGAEVNHQLTCRIRSLCREAELLLLCEFEAQFLLPPTAGNQCHIRFPQADGVPVQFLVPSFTQQANRGWKQCTNDTCDDKAHRYCHWCQGKHWIEKVHLSLKVSIVDTSAIEVNNKSPFVPTIDKVNARTKRITKDGFQHWKCEEMEKQDTTHYEQYTKERCLKRSRSSSLNSEAMRTSTPVHVDINLQGNYAFTLDHKSEGREAIAPRPHLSRSREPLYCSGTLTWRQTTCTLPAAQSVLLRIFAQRRIRARQ